MSAETARKARGAFFTPPEMANFIAKWALRHCEDRVLEPSCGEAAFLVPTVERLRELGATGEQVASQVWGAELYAPSAREACRITASSTGINLTDSVSIGDFFELRADRDIPLVDACIGNPPYVRYQAFSGDARRRGREAALEAGVGIDGLASSWAPFTVHASSFLKEGGRLGLVLPAELMSVNYAAPVRRYLLQRFASVRVILFEERVFPGVLEEVVLLLAEGEGPCDRFDVVQVRGLNELAHLDDSRWTTTPRDGKWTGLLLPDATREAITAVEQAGSFVPLEDLASISIGAVTGSNDFFCISEPERRSLGLSTQQVRRLFPPGSKHTRGISYGETAWKRARDAGARVWLFYPSTRPSPSARDYIEHGEQTALQDAYKCRVRQPWYRVPLAQRPDLFMVYMANEGPRFIRNGARLLNVNSVHGIYLRSESKQLAAVLPVASLSTFTLLGAELVGRAYGGGLLKLEPREAANLPVPGPALLKRCEAQLVRIRPAVHERLVHGRFDEAVALVDEVVLTTGLSLSRDVLDGLRQGRDQLFGRRRKRSQS